MRSKFIHLLFVSEGTPATEIILSAHNPDVSEAHQEAGALPGSPSLPLCVQPVFFENPKIELCCKETLWHHSKSSDMSNCWNACNSEAFIICINNESHTGWDWLCFGWDFNFDDLRTINYTHFGWVWRHYQTNITYLQEGMEVVNFNLLITEDSSFAELWTFDCIYFFIFL